VAFSPTEPFLAFASSGPASDGSVLTSTLHLWNAATRRMTVEIPLAENCAGLVFAQDGRTLLTSTGSGGKGTITLWRVPDGTALARYSTEQINPWTATDFAASADLSLAAYAFGFGPGRVRVLDPRNGRELWTATAAEQVVTALAFSPDGKTLATAAGYGESDIRLWDAATGRELGRLEGHEGWVGALVFWPDGGKLASASADQTIRTWDLATRKCVDVLHGHRSEVWRLALLPDGRTLASGSKDGVVCLWDTLVTHPHLDRMTWIVKVSDWRFSADGHSIVTLNAQGQVARWIGPEFREKQSLLEIGPASSPLFSNDGRFLAANTSDHSIGVWDLARGALVGQCKISAAGEFGVAILARGNRLLVYSSSENRMREWDLAAVRDIQTWHISGGALAEGGSPDERIRAVASYEGAFQFRDLAGQSTTTPTLDIQEPWHIAFAPDGKRFAVASTLGYVRVWDFATLREVATLRGFHYGAHVTNFAPDGERLAASGSTGDALKLWAVDSWQEVLSLDAPGSVFHETAFSPAGDAIGTLSGEGQLYVWRAPTWAEIAAAEKAR
jgi:WD40 repeat protein